MSQRILQVDQAMLETTLDRMVRKTVEETLNAMLDAEADEIAGATCYERSVGRKAYRAGHYERDLTVKAGRMSLKVPKPKGAIFSSAVIDRYRRREESARGGADRHVPGRRLHAPGRRRVPAPVGRPHAIPDPERQAQEGVRRHRRMAQPALGTGLSVRVHGRRVAQALPGRQRGERERARRDRRRCQRPARGDLGGGGA